MTHSLLLKIALVVLLVIGYALHGQSTPSPSIRSRYSSTPSDATIQTEMITTWTRMATGNQQAQVLEETDAPLKNASSPQHRLDIQFVRARAAILLSGAASARAPALVEEFIRAAPADDRSAELLFRLARAQSGPAAQSPIYQRAAETYPTSYWGIMSKGALTQFAGLGKPFELGFKDAVTARDVSVQRDFKGKVVVVYFWATWCSDCAAELPQMKQLYTTYKDRGVEFVGVSLDEPESAGGLAKLKEYVAERQVPWPQFFQGGDKQRSEFSAKWGVSSTPTAFLVDREGKLASTAAKGQLDKLIPELLAKSPS